MARLRPAALTAKPPADTSSITPIRPSVLWPDRGSLSCGAHAGGAGRRRRELTGEPFRWTNPGAGQLRHRCSARLVLMVMSPRLVPVNSLSSRPWFQEPEGLTGGVAAAVGVSEPVSGSNKGNVDFGTGCGTGGRGQGGPCHRRHVGIRNTTVFGTRETRRDQSAKTGADNHRFRPKEGRTGSNHGVIGTKEDGERLGSPALRTAGSHERPLF
jgi:hypothetical protein